MNKVVSFILKLGGVLLIIGALAASIVWIFYPVQQRSLQTPNIQKMTFAQAKQKVAQINQTEKAQHVKPECYSKLYAHQRPTTKTVVMFHGVAACPLQFSKLADYFYARGYNVYVPLTPEHGRADNLTHAKVTSQGLVDYINTSVNIDSALGGQVGVIGLSGGANLATWAAQYRPKVSRLLALSPFYEPSSAQSPKWQIRPLLVFYGNNILPDKLNKPDDPQHALSYRALAKYVTIFKNLPSPVRDNGLKNVAMVTAEDDGLIDKPLAHKTLSAIAKTNHQDLVRYQTPASFHLGHDIISPDNKYVVRRESFLLKKYFELYQNNR